VDHRCAKGAGIDAGFTTDTPEGIRHNSLGFRDPFPCPGWTDGYAGRIGAVLAHNGHENSDFAPFLHLNPGEGRA